MNHANGDDSGVFRLLGWIERKMGRATLSEAGTRMDRPSWQTAHTRGLFSVDARTGVLRLTEKGKEFISDRRLHA